MAASLLILIHGVCAGAAQLAFDSAADSAYNNGWTQGSNGGFGWSGGWSFTQPQYAVIGSSTTNGHGDPDGDGDINSPRSAAGRAWGLQFGDAIRTFNGPLTVGQTFSVDFDDYGASQPPNIYANLVLLAPDGTRAISLYALELPDYIVGSGTFSVDTGVADTDQGIHITFTQLTAAVQMSITPYIAGATTATFDVPYTGQIEGVDLFGFGPGGSAMPYINNIAITPEPSSAALAVFAGVLLLAGRRRASRRGGARKAW